MTARAPAWSGVNHVALLTKDLDATTRFYDTVLGAPLVGTIATDDMRHYFFRFGPQCTIAFFQYTADDEPRFEKIAGVFDPRSVHFDHLSLNLPDEDELLALQARLRSFGHPATEVIDHGVVRSIYFTDPNGIALEASWWVMDPTAGPVDRSSAYFTDPEPVPAARRS